MILNKELKQKKFKKIYINLKMNMNLNKNLILLKDNFQVKVHLEQLKNVKVNQIIKIML